MNIILYQVQHPTYYHRYCKCLIEEALDTEIATVFEATEKGIEDAYKSVRPGYTAYVLSMRQVPHVFHVLLKCKIAVENGQAKLIAKATSVKPRKLTFDWGRQTLAASKEKAGD